MNQSEILVHPDIGEVLRLAIRTETPNFEYFEIVLDDVTVQRADASWFEWSLHEGVNTLSVRPVNQFGIRGIESFVSLSVEVNTAADRSGA